MYFLINPEIRKKKLSIVDYAQIFFVFSLTLLIASTFARLGIDPHHQGIMFNAAIRLEKGYMLYRDTYFYYGALTALIHAFSLKLFGHYLVVIQLLTAFVYSIISIIMWLIWRKFLPSFLSTLICLIWLFLAPYYLGYVWEFLPWSSNIALLFSLLAAYFLIISIESNSRIATLLVGIFVSFTFWARQSVGLLLFFAILLFFLFLLFYKIFNKEKDEDISSHIKSYLLGNLLVFTIFVAWLALNDALIKYVEYSFIGQYNYFIGSKNIFNTLFDTMKGLLPRKTIMGEGGIFNYFWMILPLLPLILFFTILTNFLFLKKYSKNMCILLSFIFVCLSSWLQYYPVLCVRHAYWAATPAIGFIVFIIWQAIKAAYHYYREKELSASIFYGVLCFIIFSYFSITLYQIISFRIKRGIETIKMYPSEIKNNSILSGMKVTPSQNAGLQILYETINEYTKKYPHTTIKSMTHPPNYLYTALYITKNEKVTNNYRILIQAQTKQELTNYYELIHIKMDHPLAYEGDEIYLYAPIENNK